MKAQDKILWCRIIKDMDINKSDDHRIIRLMNKYVKNQLRRMHQIIEPSISLHLPENLSLFLSFYLSLYLSLSLPLSWSHSIYLSLSLSPSLSMSFAPSLFISLSLCLSLFLSYSLSPSISLFRPLTISSSTPHSLPLSWELTYLQWWSQSNVTAGHFWVKEHRHYQHHS